MNDSGFIIGPWRVQPRRLLIESEERHQSLRPKVMDLLLALAKSPGQVVTKDEILEQVWGGAVVGDEVLRRTVFELRKSLGDDPKSPIFVETIPRVGYRLIAPVSRDLPVDDQEVSRAEAGVPVETSGSRRWRPPLLLAVAAVLTTAVGLGFLRGSDEALRSTESAVIQQAPAADHLKLRPLTTMPGRETQPELSRDGRRLAFIGIDRDGVSDLYVLELDAGRQPIRLTDDAASQAAPAFDPTGRRLAYFHGGEGAPELRLRDLETDDVRRLVVLPSSDFEDLSWSPDGRWLAAAVRPRRGAPVAIHLYSLATGELTPLTEPPTGHQGDIFLSWSPDSERLAFVRARDRTGADLFTVGLAGESSVRRITRSSTILRGVGWNGSGDALYFLRYQPGRKSLWQVPLTDGAPRALAELGERSVELAVTAEGRRLVFAEETTRADIWRLALDEETAEPLIVSTAVDGSPAISPDGSQIAFLSNRSGYFEIWTADADGSNLRQRTWFEGPLLRYPRWSPDGERLVVGVYSGGSSEIYLVPVAGPPEQMTDDPARDEVPVFSAAGDAVYFASDRSGDWQLWRLPATGGSPEQVSEVGGFRVLDLGAEGLLFTRIGEPQLFRRGADGEVEVIAELDGKGDRERWALVGETVYYFRPGVPDLVRRRLSGGPVESLVPVNHSVLDPGVCVSPDGRYLLWTAVENSGRDLKLLEGFSGL